MPIYKEIIKILRLGKVLRKLRAYGYYIFDFIGNLFFSFFPRNYVYPEITKILLIRLDRIGDVILSTPAIRTLKRTYPLAKVDVLIKAYTRDLLANNKNINQLIVYGVDTLKPEYDLAIALHPGILPNYYAFKSGAPIRIGYRGWGGSFFLTQAINDDRARRVRHEVESALELVAVVGCRTEDRRLDVCLNQQSEIFADEFFNTNNLVNDKIVIIHPGSRQEYIRWKPERFVQVADKLYETKNTKIILTGSREEQSIITFIKAKMKYPAISFVGQTLGNLAALIKRCSLFISSSTGPMHIAAGLNVPVVAIFGNIHPLDSYKQWGPWSKNSIIVAKDIGCCNCHPSDCRKFKCMDAISVDDVFNAAEELLKKNEQ